MGRAGRRASRCTGGCAVVCAALIVGAWVRTARAEDGLAQAYAQFRLQFEAEGQDLHHRLSVGHDPLLATERVEAKGRTLEGDVTFFFDENRVTATLRNAPEGDVFELWLVRNVEAPGHSVRPERGDLFFMVGTFFPALGGPRLDELVAGMVDYDFDLAVITRAGVHPADGLIASGFLTLFEKRYFRERLGTPPVSVTGALASDVETLDPLVRRGAELFLRETFDGNGRTCATCHRPENNLTIDPTFIATLPASDPLFVAEQRPELSALEDAQLLRRFALIRENVDGFEDPTRKFVQRTASHMLALSTTLGRGDLPIFLPDGTPPDQRTGWSGDGAHGRGTLHEFALAALMQHFPRTLARRPGADFRLPTQAELDALEAFQLFNGRQKSVNTQAMVFVEPAAEAGKRLFVNEGQCVACHRDLVGGRENFMVDTGVEARSRALGVPPDGGIGVQGSLEKGFGAGRFNVPPLVEAADTAPLFHNGSAQTIEEAVAFYTGPEFAASPGRAFSGVPQLTGAQVDQLGAFLRTLNALENLRQVDKRVRFVADTRGAGNGRLLELALADLNDAVEVLSAKGLAPAALHAIRTAQLTLWIGLANPDELRAPFMVHAQIWLAEAKRALLASDPNRDF